ncbi:hypothetical protein [Thermophilibacter mediterraneus]
MEQLFTGDRSVVLYIALSVDGFIADAAGGERHGAALISARPRVGP